MVGYRDYKVLYTNILQETIVLDYITNIRLTLKKDAKLNSLELTLGNKNGKYINEGEVVFKEGEKLQIYASEGIVDTSNIDNLFGTFIIKNVNIVPDNNTIKIVAVDATYKMLSTLYTQVIDEDKNLTSRDIIFNIVQNTDYDGLTQNGINILMDTTKHDGTQFPIIGYTSAWKTSYEAINELSQPGKTGDNMPFLFWFDSDGTFHWTYPNSNPEPIPFEYFTQNVLSMSMKKTDSVVINMIIYDAGEDKNGASMLGFDYNKTADTLEGSIKFQPMTEIAKEYKKELGANYDTISNDDFIRECNKRAKNKVMSLLNAFGKGIWEVNIKTYGKKYNVGELYEVKAQKRGFPTCLLRIDSVIHSIGVNGWNTQLILHEDPAKIEY